MRQSRWRFLPLLLLVGVFSIAAQGQEGSQNDLREEILRMDKALFDAFNRGDLEPIKEIFAKDLEFYHDTGGLGDYEGNIQALAGLFARNNGLRRELVKESVEVYPVPRHGAIQTGAHTFCHLEGGEDICGTFQFVHIWKKVDGQWKVSRVVSYGH